MANIEVNRNRPSPADLIHPEGKGAVIGDKEGNDEKKSTTSFESAAKLVALLGTAVAPWRLLSDARGFVWVWLVGHAALLAPVAGVLLADYYLVRRRRLDLDGLYDETEPEQATLDQATDSAHAQAELPWIKVVAGTRSKAAHRLLGHC